MKIFQWLKSSFVLLLAVTFLLPANGFSQTRNNDALAKANRGTIGLISGSFGSTSLNLASDMAEVLDNFETGETRILAVMGSGTSQNVADLLYLKGTDLAIVQADILDHIKRNKIYRNIDGLLRYVTRLHDKQVHLLSRSENKSIEDLRGKIVNLGTQSSGSFITGSLILGVSGIEAQLTNDSQGVALRKLLAGEIDAMILADGVPSPLLASLPIEHELRFLPIENEILSAKYQASKLTHADYPQIVREEGAEIPTISVETVLAIYNWPAENKRYERAQRFIAEFFSAVPELQSSGFHPAWSAIDIRAEANGWKRFAAADAWLAANPLEPDITEEEELLRLQFEAFLKSTQPNAEWTTEQKILLFKQFTIWQGQNQ
jgi:TRAP-type uncharacterized transport system substrate-binding protein